MDRGAHRGGVGSVVVTRETAPGELELPTGTILSLEQIRAIRSSNEYTEGPAAPRRSTPAPRASASKQERTHEVILVNNNNNYEARCPASRPPPLSRSTSMGSSGSGSSEQGLLVQSPPSRPHHHLHHHHRAERPVRAQPKALSSPAQPLLLADALLKQAGAPSGPPQAPPPAPPPAGGKGDPWPSSPHQFICERCGKCKCSECTAPRPLPARLACDDQCLCSADSLLEHGTCMCLVKGLFYHCSSQDDAGDSCADQPCSLSRSRCVPRFLCMGLLAPLFPCLLCYPPAKACVRACQHCHDHLRRPGCRCRTSNTVYCKLQGWAGQQGPGHGLGRGKPS